MRVLVTRPAQQAGEWVQALQQAGIDAAALPLIAIEPAASPAEVEAAWLRLPSFAMVLFVSPNAAEHFFAARPEAVPAAWPAGVLAASPGPGTTRTLGQLGVAAGDLAEPAADAPQFDSEALWQVIGSRDWRGARVLVVRGTSGRDWLAARLQEAGAEVEFVAAYRRAPPRPDAPARAAIDQALATPGGHVWFFSSSEAVAHLGTLCPGASWAASRALATHPRIAETARGLGFGQVVEARPAVAAVVACLQSLA